MSIRWTNGGSHKRAWGAGALVLLCTLAAAAPVSAQEGLFVNPDNPVQADHYAGVLATCPDLQRAQADIAAGAAEASFMCYDLTASQYTADLLGIQPSTADENLAVADPVNDVGTPTLGDDFGYQAQDVTGLAGRQSDYLWTFSDTAAYGKTDRYGRRYVVGTVQISARSSMNGAQSRNFQSAQVKSGPAIRQYLYFDCVYKSNNSKCATRKESIAPTYDHNYWSGNGDFYHSLGRKYYVSFNQYIRALGQPNPSSPDGRYHFPPLHTSTFTCRTTDGMCRFDKAGGDSQ